MRELAWADVVAVMDVGHAAEIERQWPAYSSKLRVLGVPDDYDPEEPELRELLTAKILTFVQRLGRPPSSRGSRSPG
jgi:predicted protein tyrosine phosphatase